MADTSSLRSPARRKIFYPLLMLGSAALVLFFGFFILDWIFFRPADGTGPFALLFSYDVDTLQNALGNLSQVLAAVLGIVITVASIIVQLAATRYTPRIADMFFRDRTNLGVLGFFVVACINAVWVSISISHNFLPRISVTVTLVLVTASLLVMVPYFAYVFDFLDPERVVSRLQKQAIDFALLRSDDDSVINEPAVLGNRQERALAGVEQLADIAVNAVSQKDKAMAVNSLDAIKDLALTYLPRKSKLEADWFRIGPGIRRNTDFVALTDSSIEDIERSRTWLEWKVLRQFQLVYNESLGEMPDINHLISINTRYLGQAALDVGDEQALALSLKFFNTYMRSTLNTSRVRTAYNVLNQYRQLAEYALSCANHATLGQVAFYLKYYGQTANAKDMAFVTETVAYDLGALCERAFTAKSPAHEIVLKHLLELDREPETPTGENSLRGVRKAQAKLAAFYLSVGAEPEARRIYADMQAEKPERLRSIRDELMGVVTRDFWEVNDRGTNFDYLEPPQKEQLKIFFSWFPNLPL